MKTLTIYYYSGTGRTAAFVRQLAQKLGGKFDLDIIRLEKSSAGRGENCIVAYPLYAGKTPAPVLHFLKSGITEGHRRLILLAGCSFAFFAKAHLRSITRLSFREGIGIDGFHYFHLPSRLRIAHFFQKISMADSQKTEAAQICSEIVSGNTKLPLNMGFNIIAAFIGVFYNLVLGLQMKRLRVSGGCIRCGRCIRNCPANNIEMFRGIQFDKNCVHCFRCVSLCPVKAISFPGNETFFDLRR